MGTNLNKSPEHLGYIDEIHRLNTEFDVIELIHYRAQELMIGPLLITYVCD